MEKVIFLFGRRSDVSREEFFRHYLDVHSSLGLRLTLGLHGYTVNLVDSDTGPDAITEIWTTSANDLLDPSKSYASKEDAAVVLNDHNSFIGPMDVYVAEELVVRGEPLDSPLREPTPEPKLVWLACQGDGFPELTTTARRVVDNRIVRRLTDESPDLTSIRMVWGAELQRTDVEDSGGLALREYRQRIAQESSQSRSVS